VEFSPSVLYGAKVTFKGKKINNIDWAEVNLEKGWFEHSKILNIKAVRDALAELVSKLNIKKALDVVTCVYSPVAMANVVNLPVKNSAELLEYLELEADKIVPLPLSILNVDYYFLEKKKRESRVLLAFAKKEIVYKYRDLVLHVGLKLKSVSVRCVALTNLALYGLGLGSIPKDRYIFLDTNGEVLSYSIIDNKDVLSCRDIPITGVISFEDVVDFMERELDPTGLDFSDFTIVGTKRMVSELPDYVERFEKLSEKDAKKMSLFEFVEDFDKTNPCIDVTVGLTLQELRK